MLQRMCRETFSMYYTILNIFPIIIFNYLPDILLIEWEGPIIDLDVLLWLGFLCSAVYFLYFAISVINQLCSHLNIKCFSIPVNLIQDHHTTTV